jgi:predicted transcriptional regulator/predicted phosphodiesterase
MAKSRVSSKSLEAVSKAASGGATVKELIAETGLGKSAIYRALELLQDSGEITKETLYSGEVEYYFLGDLKDLPDIKMKERKERLTGIRLTNHESTVHRLLRAKSMTVGELSRSLNKPMGVSKEYIYKILQSLQTKGFSVSVDEARKEAKLDTSEITKEGIKPLELEPLYKHRIRFGIVSDTQLGSRYQQLTLLRTTYQIFEEEKVDFVINPGDLVDGIKMYRGQEQETFLHGADEQKIYAINNYPHSKNFKTYIIAGNHDLIFKKIAGYNIVESICAERDDLVYKGEIGCHTFKVKNLTFDVLHPTGGVPYAKSYRLQKVIEGALGDIISRMRMTNDASIIPHFMILGHLHIVDYCPHIGIKGIIAPCLQSQTPYLKAKGYMPEVGCIILDVECDDDWNANRILIDHRDFSSYVKENDY